MNPNPQSTSSNFHQTELDKFAALANRWWDADGPQKPLHALNPVRLDYVAARVALPGARVLDVGCGGGLLSEAMARLGAQVTAIDLAPELVKVARLHSLESSVQVDYRVQSVEDLAAEQPGSFDAVTCMEMLEHVPDPLAIIRACASLLKPGGTLFLSTLNRTPAAFALAVVGAEYIARLLPRARITTRISSSRPNWPPGCALPSCSCKTSAACCTSRGATARACPRAPK